MTYDKFSQFPADFTMQPGDAFAITPNDENLLAQTTRFIYAGGAGALKVKTISGAEVTFVAVPVGTILPVRAVKVFATGTVASNLIGLV